LATCLTHASWMGSILMVFLVVDGCVMHKNLPLGGGQQLEMGNLLKRKRTWWSIKRVNNFLNILLQ
jgi:hypothetical protein